MQFSVRRKKKKKKKKNSDHDARSLCSRASKVSKKKKNEDPEKLVQKVTKRGCNKVQVRDDASVAPVQEMRNEWLSAFMDYRVPFFINFFFTPNTHFMEKALNQSWLFAK